MRGRSRWDTGQYRPSRGHRDADLDEATAVSARRNVPIDPNEVAKTGVPFGGAGQAQDSANGVLFLASDASRLMKSPPSTGQVALELTWGGNKRHCVKRGHGSVSRDTFASLPTRGGGSSLPRSWTDTFWTQRL